jgi:hypothetical protein
MRRLWTSGLGPGYVTVLVLFLAVFRHVLFLDGQFAFQDAGHYYYPLLQRVQQEWDAGRWPLWTPEANAGAPLLGDPTAAVLYPGKLVFFVLPHRWAVRVFLLGHVGLAFGTMSVLLRGWGVSATGALIGALAYSFGVPVLSQTSNMIFLVGAAWAPLGFLAADRWIRGRSRRALTALTLVLAMQVLGGDPEAAYLVVISAAGYAAGLAASASSAGLRRVLLLAAAGLAVACLGLLGLSWWSARAVHAAAVGDIDAPAPWQPPADAFVAAAWGASAVVVARRAWIRSRIHGRGAWRLAAGLGGLIAASGLALALAAAQFLPVLEYARLSFRAAGAGYHNPYAYSAHPLQLFDMVWPNVFGTMEGGYRSWLNALPPKPGGRLWMPSIYLGGLTIVLAVAGAGFRGGAPWRTWMSVLAVVSMLGALGYHMSPLLWARYVAGGASALGPLEPPFSWRVRSDGYLRDGDGGVYWLLASALPGFGAFRYPPKLFVVWSLAVSALAGAGWDGLASASGRWRRASVAAAWLLAASVVVLAASWIGAGPLHSWFDSLAQALRASDEPLDVARAIAELRTGIAHGALAMAFALGIARFAPRRPVPAGWVALAGLALDLGVANACHIVTAPQSAFEAEPRALEVIKDAEKAHPSAGPYRVQRVGRWWPERWAGQTSPRRFDEIVRWERDTLRPNYGLPAGVAWTFYFDTLAPLDYGLFFLPWLLDPDAAAQREFHLRPGQKVWYYPRRGFDLWNTRYFIVPGRLAWDSEARGYASVIPHSTFIYPRPGFFQGPEGAAPRARWQAAEDFRILRNEAAFPRAWVVHRAYVVPAVRGLVVADRVALMQKILYQGDEFWRAPGTPVRDPRRVAWVETDNPQEVDRFLSRAAPDPSETATVTLEEPQRVELTAVLRSPGLVVVSDMYYPGWTVTVDGHPAEIFRTNRAMRGVTLPAGRHRLVFRYTPLSFRIGTGLSLLGLISLAVLFAWTRREPASFSDRSTSPDFAR